MDNDRGEEDTPPNRNDARVTNPLSKEKSDGTREEEEGQAFQYKTNRVRFLLWNSLVKSLKEVTVWI